MTISLETIDVGVENQATGSDSLFTAFTKTKNNFSKLSSVASQYTNFVGSTGITTTSVGNTVTILNTGVVSLVAGTGLTISTVDGVSTLSISGYGNSTLVAGVTSVGLTSSTLTVTSSPVISTGTLSVNLPTTGIVPGYYTSPDVTVDSYGRITSISNTSTAGTVTSVAIAAGSGISVTGGPITNSGTITVNNTGVTRLNAGAGITLSGSNGEVTIGSELFGGTVTSVGVSSSTLTVSGSPISTSGTISVELPSTISLSGNISSGNATLGNLVTANYFTGNGSLLTGITATKAGTVTTNAQPNITSVGTLTTLTSGTHTISANANISMSGSLSQLSGANLISGTYITGTLTTAAQPNITSTGTLTTLTSGTHTISANANISMSGSLSQVSGANLISGTYITGTLTTAAQPNITSTGTLSSTTLAANANITMSGSLSRITGGNLVSATYLTGTLTTGAQPNVTSVGTLSSLTSTGTITADTLTANSYINIVGGALYYSNNGNYIALSSQDGVSANYVFGIPKADGTANSFLATDGAGSLSFKTPAISPAPSTASSTGVAGQIAYDSSYVYICVATDTWKRAAIATWP